ncbi:hypothetical protein SAMN05444392_103232 [Seinonella peptonophila]|uniref:Uncharacterized protein n=1 Tax=Seinonella peptonophila TaxID=112248 RepID=A0A1M4WI42_9BACL|nr:hypothetical protein [Seinonella peptonophila]SHE80896.1 hypothetical protein SAMN05444392_103232 [Seinonella peptonophila]
MPRFAPICFILTGTLLVSPVSAFANNDQSEQPTDQQVLEQLEQKNILLYSIQNDTQPEKKEDPNDESTKTPKEKTEEPTTKPEQEKKPNVVKKEKKETDKTPLPKPVQQKKKKVVAQNQNYLDISFRLRKHLLFVNASLIDITEGKGLWRIELNGKRITNTTTKEVEAIFSSDGLKEHQNRLEVFFQGEADEQELTASKMITFDHPAEKKATAQQSTSDQKQSKLAIPKSSQKHPCTTEQAKEPEHLVSISIQNWLEKTKSSSQKNCDN